MWLTPIVVLVVYAVHTPHWAGWLLVYASYFLVLVDSRLRRDKAASVAIGLGLTAHHAASLVNTYITTLPGAEFDARTFHVSAANLVAGGRGWEFTVGSDLYEYILAELYGLGGSSILFGQELSVLAFGVSCLVFVRFLDLFRISELRAWSLLVFGLWPSFIVLGSLTLREPWQLLLFMLGAYGGIRMLVRPTWWAPVLCAGALLAMGLLHQILLGFAVVAIFLLLGASVWSSPDRKKSATVLLGVTLVTLLVGMVLATSVNTDPGDDYLAMVLGGPVEALMEYRAAIDSVAPRSAYGVDLDGSSVSGLVVSAFVVYVYYLFAPFPWHVAGALDAVALAESLLRAVLLAGAVLAVRDASGSIRRGLVALLVLYLLMTSLWALGTTNYGQGLRHHLLTNWILIIAASPSLVAWWRELRARTGSALRVVSDR